MKELEASVLYNGKTESTKDCMRISLGILERDKVEMHKPRCSLVDGMILDITQNEILEKIFLYGLKEESDIERHKKTHDF